MPFDIVLLFDLHNRITRTDHLNNLDLRSASLRATLIKNSNENLTTTILRLHPYSRPHSDYTTKQANVQVISGRIAATMSSARRGGKGQARGAFQNGSQSGDERTGRRDSHPKRGASSASIAAPSGPRNSSKPFRGQKNNNQRPPVRSSTPTSQTNPFQGTRINSTGGGDSWAQRYKTVCSRPVHTDEEFS